MFLPAGCALSKDPGGSHLFWHQESALSSSDPAGMPRRQRVKGLKRNGWPLVHTRGACRLFLCPACDDALQVLHRPWLVGKAGYTNPHQLSHWKRRCQPQDVVWIIMWMRPTFCWVTHPVRPFKTCSKVDLDSFLVRAVQYTHWWSFTSTRW